MSDETPVEERLRDTAKRMRRIFDAEPEAVAIDCGREAIRLLDLFMRHSRIEEPELATVYSDMLALLRRCREGGLKADARAPTGAAPMTPTREQLTAEQAIAQIKRVLETDDGYDTAVSAIERIVAAALAPQEAAPMPPTEVGDIVITTSGNAEVLSRQDHADHWNDRRPELLRAERIAAIYRTPMWRRP